MEDVEMGRDEAHPQEEKLEEEILKMENLKKELEDIGLKSSVKELDAKLEQLRAKKARGAVPANPRKLFEDASAHLTKVTVRIEGVDSEIGRMRQHMKEMEEEKVELLLQKQRA
eukprot:4310895-Alexandrium_andersonii.AAC.1